MKIVSIGRQFPLKEVEYIEFGSKYTLLDYDLILWDPSTLLYEYSSGEKHLGYPSLDSHNSVKILEDRARRSGEIEDLIKLGRTVVIFVPSPNKFYIDTGERTYSGTGRNQKTTILVSEVSLRSFIPFSGDFVTVKANGFQIDSRGDELFRMFWKANTDNLYYEAYFTHNIGRPFLYVHGTNRIVGSWIRYERGNLLLLPHFAEGGYFTLKSDYMAAAKVFISSLTNLATLLQKETGDFTLPKWTSAYKLPSEEELRQELRSLQEDLKKTADLIEKKRLEISSLEKYKLLISGKGPALQKQVIDVLQELGIHAEEGPPGRDDIILSFEGQVGVAEVKGTNKSAAEAHAAQLEKWVGEYLTEHGIKPKGILIVNPFHDVPLSERTEDAFPNQMLKYSIDREHCLITTVQLLGMLLSTRDLPEKKSNAVRSIFSTIGIFKGFEDFSSYLQVNQQIIQETRGIVEQTIEQPKNKN